MLGLVSNADGLIVVVDADGRVTGHKVLVTDAANTDALVVTVAGPQLRLVHTADATVKPAPPDTLGQQALAYPQDQDG